jgi:hypothetical protein
METIDSARGPSTVVKVAAVLIGLASVSAIVYYLVTPSPQQEKLNVVVSKQQATSTQITFEAQNLAQRTAITIQTVYLDGEFIRGTIVSASGLSIAPGSTESFSIAIVNPMSLGSLHQVTLVFTTGETTSFQVTIA